MKLKATEAVFNTAMKGEIFTRFFIFVSCA
jgi:hypothetical protein